MSAFSINSGAVVLWDSLSGGSTNATLDTYTVSALSTLKIDTDSYQCANHSAAVVAEIADLAALAELAPTATAIELNTNPLEMELP